MRTSKKVNNNYSLSPCQTTDTVIMIRPDSFSYNPQTLHSNAFQQEISSSQKEIQKQANREFVHTVSQLRIAGVSVIVLPSRKDIETPDAVFPNNWFTHHSCGTLVLYPMHAPNRREERQTPLLIHELKKNKFPVTSCVDLSLYEDQDLALEGTGSMVFDRVGKVAFSVESLRASKTVFEDFCYKLGFKGVFFQAHDENMKPIYHTNVILSIGTKFAVLCADTITDKKEKELVIKTLKTLKKEIIYVSPSQMRLFGANVLELKTKNGNPIIIMSQKAYDAYNPAQLKKLRKYGKLLPFSIHTIETIGGGSARCILAEVFKPNHQN